MTMKYKTNLTIFNSYFDLNDKLSLKALLSIFQDVATIHAGEIGAGYEDCLKENLFWVLCRVKIDILKTPSIDEVVTVETWPHEKGVIDFDRDMLLTNKQGETLVKATSKWCVIDTRTRQLMKTDGVNYKGKCILDKLYDEKFMKIHLPKEEFTKKFTYEVRFSDLDHNGHMNNTNYANLVVNAIKNRNISHFEIDFLSELKEGERVEVSSLNTENGEYVVGKKDEKTVFSAYIR